MHLTLESLHKAKSTCSEIQGLEALMSAEDRIAITEQVAAVSGAITDAISTIDALNQMKGSLEACGYSEEWFDNVCAMGFKDLVELDMPKFFDNKVNRQQVCMEGFMDTIKAWLKKAWEMLKRLFGWLRDRLSWLVKYLGLQNDNIHKKAAWAFDMIDKKADEYFSKKAGVDLNDWYCLESVPGQLDAINTLLQYVGDFGFLYKDINSSAPGNNTDEEMKQDLFTKLNVALNNAGYSATANNVYRNGFILQCKKGEPRIVEFVTQYTVHWPETTKLQLRSKQQIMDLRTLLDTDLPKRLDDVKKAATLADSNIKGSITTQEDRINKIMTSVQPDVNTMNFCRKYIIQANLSVKVAVDAIAYLIRVNQFVAHNCDLVKKLAQAMQ